MDLIDRILADNRAWAGAHFAGPAALVPSRHLVVVTCMDSRIDVFGVLGLHNGEAHVIRNAGGLVTDDVLRSVALSQRRLGTVDVVVVQHTDCGMHGFDADGFREELAAESGVAPPWTEPGFDDLDDSIRRQLGVVRTSPWLRRDGVVSGFVYDVDTGHLRQVD